MSVLEEATTKLRVVQNSYPVISDEAYSFIQLYLITVMGPSLAIFGTASNVIITVVYYKQTVKDSITVSYIALAIWDAGLSLLTLMTIVCVTIENCFPLPYIDFSSVQFVYIAYTRSVTHMLSILVTVYLSVELCICIMIPLKVKLMFTKTRSIIVNFAMVVLSIAFNSPPWTTQRLSWQYNQRFNCSRLSVSFTAGRQEADIFFAIFNGNIVPISSQFISILCAALLISGINKSMRFRKQITINQPEHQQHLDCLPPGPAAKHRSFVQKKMRTPQAATDKYIKLAKVTVLITVVFLVCNVPVIVVALARTIVPGLNNNVKLFGVLYYVVYASTLINSSANILVYYYSNKRFRKTLLAVVLGTGHTCEYSHGMSVGHTESHGKTTERKIA